MAVRQIVLVCVLAALAGCKPDYSANSYSSSAVQQANKVDQGVVVGRRSVGVAGNSTTGALAGAAAGGVAGAQVGVGATSALTAIGGSVVGGLLGGAAEKAVGTTTAFEYVVRKSNGEMLSVTQQDAAPLAVGQKVLVIAGNQARIVADYTVTLDPAPPQPTPGPTPAPPPVAAAPLADVVPGTAPPTAGQASP